jgi:hypothetical protein
MDKFRQVTLVLERVLEGVVEDLQVGFGGESKVSCVCVGVQGDWFLVLSHVLDNV